MLRNYCLSRLRKAGYIVRQEEDSGTWMVVSPNGVYRYFNTVQGAYRFYIEGKTAYASGMLGNDEVPKNLVMWYGIDPKHMPDICRCMIDTARDLLERRRVLPEVLKSESYYFAKLCRNIRGLARECGQVDRMKELAPWAW